MNVEIEIGDDLYIVEVDEFSPPRRYSWGEPPEGGEIVLAEAVTKVPETDQPFNERPRSKIPIEEFLSVYAEHFGVEPMASRSNLEERCYDELMDRRADEFDDR